MFLFTTPTPPAAPATKAPVIDAIRQGAESTGISFDYLLRTAKRESSLDPSAKAPTSSATGLFQFIEQTWLGLVKRDGDRLGLAEEARAVTARPDGTFAVADPEARQAILDLRRDPQLASAMAGALTRQNRESLLAAIGREPDAGELYMAHVLGARGAADLIRTAHADPTRPAASDFPEAARANRSIFYGPGSRPRGAAEVYGLLASAQGGPDPATTPAAAQASAAPAPPFRPPGLQGIFQTGPRTGPLSDAVARIWQTKAGTGAPEQKVAAYFPRSTPIEEDTELASVESDATAAASEAPQVPAAAPSAVDIPLPPIRPSFAPPSTERPAGALNLKVYARSRRP